MFTTSSLQATLILHASALPCPSHPPAILRLGGGGGELTYGVGRFRAVPVSCEICCSFPLLLVISSLSLSLSLSLALSAYTPVCACVCVCVFSFACFVLFFPWFSNHAVADAIGVIERQNRCFKLVLFIFSTPTPPPLPKIT